MIKSALRFVKRHLGQHLALYFELDEDPVIINALLNLDGGALEKNQNKVVVTMINLDHETSRQYTNSQRNVGHREIADVNPAQLFNIDLLITANFDDYEEALKFLSATITFFQANPSFNANRILDMPDGISRLDFEIENSSFLDTHNLWSAMGAKYQPSIIYKMRHIEINAEQINTLTPAVTNIAAAAS